VLPGWQKFLELGLQKNPPFCCTRCATTVVLLNIFGLKQNAKDKHEADVYLVQFHLKQEDFLREQPCGLFVFSPGGGFGP
jgi:hypothetical protein